MTSKKEDTKDEIKIEWVDELIFRTRKIIRKEYKIPEEKIDEELEQYIRVKQNEHTELIITQRDQTYNSVTSVNSDTSKGPIG